MNEYVLRNESCLPGGSQDWVRPLRDAFRDHGDNGKDGVVLEDADCIVRCHGRNYGTDSIGKLAIVEAKNEDEQMGFSKEFTFGLLDSMCRKDCRYLGYYILRTRAGLFQITKLRREGDRLVEPEKPGFVCSSWVAMMAHMQDEILGRTSPTDVPEELSPVSVPERAEDQLGLFESWAELRGK